MKKFKFLPLIALIASLSYACSSDDDKDTTKPTIEIVNPTEGAHLQIGETFKLIVKLSDNEGLSSCKIDIHSNHDHHGGHGDHKHSVSTYHGDHADDETHFAYQKIVSIPGGVKEYTLDLAIEIPATMQGKAIEAGDYHLVVYAVDQALNEDLAFKNITLE